MKGGCDKSEVGTASKENGCTLARNLFRAISFWSALSTVHVAWRNIALHALTAELL